MSIADTFRADAAKLLPLVEFVAVAEHVTGIGGPAAETGIEIIRAALASLAGSASGAVSADQVAADLAKLRSVEASDDAAADAVIAKRLAETTGTAP